MRESAREAREALYESLFDKTLDGLAYCRMIFDAAGAPADFVYLEVNRNFEALTGLKDVVGKKATELVPGIQMTNLELFAAYNRISEEDGPTESFESFVPALGRWFSISAYSPKKGFFVAIFQNITERKRILKDLDDSKIAARNVLEDLQVERAHLAEAKAKDEALLESLGEGVIAVAQDGTVIVTNKVAEKTLDLASKELVGKSFMHSVILEDEQGRRIGDAVRPISTALLSGKTTSGTYYFVRKDMTKFPAAITATPVLLDGKLNGAVIVFRDITKELEIDRAKSEFVSLASHQLRTPLTGIEWTIELFAKKERLTEEGKRYLDDIRFSVKRLSALIKLLLDVSRIESGRVGIFPEPLELVTFIEDQMREFQALRQKKNVSLAFAGHPESLGAVADKNIFGYILQNLVSNAIEYTPARGTVEVSLEQQGSAALLSVRDTGIGIPKSEQAHIFGKFVRASNANSVKPDGTGLGLYIAAEAARLLGGKIWFQSEEGKGSTFFVKLPLKAVVRKEQGTVLEGQFIHYR